MFQLVFKSRRRESVGQLFF